MLETTDAYLRCPTFEEKLVLGEACKAALFHLMQYLCTSIIPEGEGIGK